MRYEDLQDQKRFEREDSKSALESEIGVHVDIGREMEEFPGQVTLGVIGTAGEDVKAMEMINDSLMNFRDQHSPSIAVST